MSTSVSTRNRRLFGILATASLTGFLGLAAPAAATTYMELGGYIPSDTPSAMALTITEDLSFVKTGSSGGAQISGFIPLVDGRYALTAELRSGGQSTSYMGVGAGIGKLNNQPGFIVDAIAGLRLPLPNLSLGLRFYASTAKGAGTGGFVGVRLKL
jgi:hypothetical protein